jgi:hypothetical protein
MITKLQSLIRCRLGISITRAIPAKEMPIPMVMPHAARLIYFHDLLSRIHRLDGDIVECGVGWGRSLYAMAVSSILLKRPRKMTGFDSFEGFPEPTPEDNAGSFGIKKGRYATTEQAVRHHLALSGLPEDFVAANITLVKGFFADTVPAYGGRIALLHLDGDLYDSYRVPLSHLYDKMVPGGIIAFDEYQNATYTGATQAIDEFFAGREPIQRSPLIDRFFVVKAP